MIETKTAMLIGAACCAVGIVFGVWIATAVMMYSCLTSTQRSKFARIKIAAFWFVYDAKDMYELPELIQIPESRLADQRLKEAIRQLLTRVTGDEMLSQQPPTGTTQKAQEVDQIHRSSHEKSD